jgi:hypothetical protein
MRRHLVFQTVLVLGFVGIWLCICIVLHTMPFNLHSKVQIQYLTSYTSVLQCILKAAHKGGRYLCVYSAFGNMITILGSRYKHLGSCI